MLQYVSPVSMVSARPPFGARMNKKKKRLHIESLAAEASLTKKWKKVLQS